MQLINYALPVVCGFVLIAAGIFLLRRDTEGTAWETALGAAPLLIGAWLLLSTVQGIFDFSSLSRQVARQIYPILIALALIVLACGAFLWRSGDRRYGTIWLSVGSLFLLIPLVGIVLSILH